MAVCNAGSSNVWGNEIVLIPVLEFRPPAAAATTSKCPATPAPPWRGRRLYYRIRASMASCRPKAAAGRNGSVRPARMDGAGSSSSSDGGYSGSFDTADEEFFAGLMARQQGRCETNSSNVNGMVHSWRAKHRLRLDASSSSSTLSVSGGGEDRRLRRATTIDQFFRGGGGRGEEEEGTTPGDDSPSLVVVREVESAATGSSGADGAAAERAKALRAQMFDAVFAPRAEDEITIRFRCTQP